MRAEWLLDLAGRATKKTLGNSAYTVYQHDVAGRVTSLYNRKSDATVISSFEYLRDAVGNPTKVAMNGGDYVLYDYDLAYQLSKEVRKDSGDATLYSNAFWYDPAGPFGGRTDSEPP